MSFARAHVTSEDGATIAVEDSFAALPEGARSALEGAAHVARPVILLHGIAQSRRAWRPVLEGPLGRSHRVVAVDMRGHGDSSAPAGEEAYTKGDRLGADLHAVIGTLGLTRPVVVAWSYGGVMIGEYLRRYGAGALGGILFVGAAVKVGKPARALFGPVMMDNAKALLSDDAALYEAGARAFLAGCAAGPVARPFLDESLREMLRVPVHVRRALLTRSLDYSTEIAACDAPIATLHGDHDAVVLPQMSDELARLRPDVTQTSLPRVGHLPWLEAPGAFDAALRGILGRAQGVA